MVTYLQYVNDNLPLREEILDNLYALKPIIRWFELVYRH